MPPKLVKLDPKSIKHQLQRASDQPVFRILKNLKPISSNEKFLIKNKNGQVIRKSENLDKLIKKTNWNKKMSRALGANSAIRRSGHGLNPSALFQRTAE